MASKKKLKRKVTRLTHLNNSLKKEIQVLVFEPNSMRATEIQVMYHMLRDMENTVMFGTVQYKPTLPEPWPPCESCKHFPAELNKTPCVSCNPEYDKWQPKEERK